MLHDNSIGINVSRWNGTRYRPDRPYAVPRDRWSHYYRVKGIKYPFILPLGSKLEASQLDAGRPAPHPFTPTLPDLLKSDGDLILVNLGCSGEGEQCPVEIYRGV
jgi:hypothetical protein